MQLQNAVSQVFDPHGPLATGVALFKQRLGQTRMALEVARTMEQGGALVVEAGTGVGKTFANLVPALLSGQRVLLSTATKALQDQLFRRDIPHLLKILGLPVRVALLKGRSSYLCLQRMESARQEPRAADLNAIRDLARIQTWAPTTGSGDLAELRGLDENSPVIPLVTSTRENCLGGQCPKAQQCHVNLARAQAMAADLVVINHHLFFADANVRESGVAELLPTVHCVVFDEAHQLNDIGVQFLGRQLSTGQLAGFSRDLSAQGPRWAAGVTNWALMVLDLDRAIHALRTVMGTAHGPAVRRRWDVDSPEGLDPQRWFAVINGLRQVLGGAVAALAAVADTAIELKKLGERATELEHTLASYAGPVEPDCVRWLEVGQQLRLIESPMDIAATMRPKVHAQDRQAGAGQRSWIFTSATLGADPSMAWFVKSCGLESAQLLQVQSPFDYAAQASLFVPPYLPKPSEQGHSNAMAELAIQGATALRGRTLVLTTTLRAMRAIGEVLALHFSTRGGVDVLVQGQASKRELVERFCQGDRDGARGCVLVGSASFWEGIDIAGDALQLLIIDKLPFSPPDDPLVEARVQQLEAQGDNAFRTFHLPQATIALKQGIGRLIRSETDRGVLVIGDVRLTQTGYGRKMLAALPSMPMLSTQAQFADALTALRR